jgi:FixJ family two-component response regulator
MIQSSALSSATWLSATSDATPRVFIVDDDISVRESLELLIRSAGWAAETYTCAEEFLTRSKVSGPSCLVLDVQLPGVNGLDLQERVATDRASTPIVFITGHGDVPMTVRAMKAGAVEVLTKPLRDDVLLAAISDAVERSNAELRRDAESRMLRDLYASLTRREREVLALVVAGRLNKQVAAELDISEITVKAHRGKVMRKMKVRSLPDLVKIAAKLGVAA